MPTKKSGSGEKKPVRVSAELLAEVEKIAIEESAKTGQLLTLSETLEKLLNCGIKCWRRDN